MSASSGHVVGGTQHISSGMCSSRRLRSSVGFGEVKRNDILKGGSAAAWHREVGFSAWMGDDWASHLHRSTGVLSPISRSQDMPAFGERPWRTFGRCQH